MSLGTALNISFIGLRRVESGINTASQNVTNADKTGYTRKTFEAEYTTTSSGTVPTGGKNITSNYDQYLYKSMVEDASDSGYTEITSNYLSNYTNQLGQTDGDSTLNTSLDNFASSLDSLTQVPEDGSAKADVVRNAELLTYEIRNLSNSVQNLRLQADKDIETAITDLNQSLVKIQELNERILRAQSSDLSIADLEDDRRVALETVSSYINIDYFVDKDNQVKIYTDGRALLDSKARTLDYTSQNTVNSSVTYPGGFNAISLNGVDMTTSITGGKIGALIELRDSTFVSEQDKLDEYANVLRTEVNRLNNQGSSLPARTQMIGETQGLTGATAFIATGFVKISTVDVDGDVVSTANIDLSLTLTINDVVTAINTALGPNVTASLTANGELQLVSNVAGEGLALNQLGSDVGGDSFSQFFGLNNMFSGTGAENLYVSDYLIANSDFISTSRLLATAIVGDVGLNPGDSSLTEELNNLIYSDVSFAAAGNFGAQNASLSLYVDRIMSDVATQADNALEENETVGLLFNQTKISLENLSGVNIDEEMARITELEAKYEASATIIGSIQGLFDELLAAVR